VNLPLKTSLLVNIALAGWLLLTSILRQDPTKPSVPGSSTFQAEQAAVEPAVTNTGSLQGGARPAGQVFSWRQIESTDYRVYISNLRSIGCPEQTIRDIVKADVGNLYAGKRLELAGDSEALQQWSREAEGQLLAALLGEVVKHRPTLAASTSPSPPIMPLVLRPVDPKALGLSDDQMAAIEELRGEFIRSIGGTNQNPTDPAYASRWRKAQPESDAAVRGMIGVSAFLQYQNESE
jgi:hypothetical protein